MRRFLPLLLILALPLQAWAEAVYVRDMLRVGVRAEPDSNESPMAIVTTGSKLEVLDRRGGYVKIRTDEGVEGWVNDAYTSPEVPARIRIKEVKARNQALEEELARAREKAEAKMEELRATAAATVEENDRLTARLEALEEANASLRSRLHELNPAAEPKGQAEAAVTDRRWWVYLGGVLALLLVGFLWGARWQRGRVADRLGGMDL
ncbi:MAG TPA: TIGR04211 family SH3 domain-containing protein [Gammaproteobacteria bacterium]|nr:TIGR04211 family SH3 domain-containing protein [Gammaproteobacteria bacterium]